MSNLRKCSHRSCKKEINIKKEPYFTFQLDKATQRNKEYLCHKCGIEAARNFYHEGSISIIRECMEYATSGGKIHSGSDLFEVLKLLEDLSLEELESIAKSFKSLGISV